MCASSCIKQYVQPSYGCRGMPVVAGMCLYCVKQNFNTVDREIFVLKIIRALKFHGAKFS